jgi:hypothetical protein
VDRTNRSGPVRYRAYKDVRQKVSQIDSNGASEKMKSGPVSVPVQRFAAVHPRYISHGVSLGPAVPAKMLAIQEAKIDYSGHVDQFERLGSCSRTDVGERSHFPLSPRRSIFDVLDTRTALAARNQQQQVWLHMYLSAGSHLYTFVKLLRWKAPLASRRDLVQT